MQALLRLLVILVLPLLVGVGSWGARDIAPYLTRPTQQGITVAWETAAATTTVVEVGEQSGALETAHEDASLVNFHQVVLEGLSPNSTYFYRVISRDGNGTIVLESEVKSFPTARTRAEPFRFAFFAETHSAPAIRTATQADFASAVEEWGAHLLLNSGDHVNDGEDMAQWTQFFIEAGAMIDHIPLMNSWGNHDDADVDSNPEGESNEPATLFFDHPGNERYYAYEYGAVLLIALDPMWQYDGQSDEAMQWLESTLADANDGVDDPPYIVVMLHPPFYGANKDAGSCLEALEVTWVKEHVQPLLETYRVSLVLSGHEMMYARATVNGVTYIQVTSSDKLREVNCPREELESVTMNPSILRAEVTCEGMTAEGFILEGFAVGDLWLVTNGSSVFDTFTISPRANTNCADANSGDADAGSVEPGPDAGAAEGDTDAGAITGPGNSNESGGCGCVASRSAANLGGFLLLCLGLILLRRRRS